MMLKEGQNAEGIGMTDWLESEEFYLAMQGYRCAPMEDQREVMAHFENVKQLLRKHAGGTQDTTTGDLMNHCRNCEGRGQLETGIAEASSIQCRRCDGTGIEPDIKELLKRRILKEHNGEYEPAQHHWNLTKHDSLLHWSALRVIEDLERTVIHLRGKHAFSAKPETCIGNSPK